jgi:hypothetical protein
VGQPAFADASVTSKKNCAPLAPPRRSQGIFEDIQFGVSTDKNGAQRPLDDHPSYLGDSS